MVSYFWASPIDVRRQVCPHDYNVIRCLAELADLYQFNKQPQLQIATLQQIEGLRYEPKIINKIADVYEMIGDLKNSIRYYQKLEALTRAAPVLWKIATLFDQTGNNKQAIRYLERLVKQNPFDKKYLYYLAQKYEEDTQIAKAIRIYTRLLEIEKRGAFLSTPSSFNFLPRLTFSFFPTLQAAPPASISTRPDSFHQAYQNEPQFPKKNGPRPPAPTSEQTTITNKIRGPNKSKAASAPEENFFSSELPPELEPIRHDLAKIDRLKLKLIDLYEANNELNKSILLYQELLPKFPQNLYLRNRLALNYVYTNQTKKAAKTYTDILQYAPHHRLALQFLFGWMAEQGQTQEALGYFRRYRAVIKENDLTKSDYFHLEEMYQTLKDDHSYQKTCNKILTAFGQEWKSKPYTFYSVLRCNQKLHPSQVKNLFNAYLSQFPVDHQVRSDYVDYLLEQKNITASRQQLDYLVLYQASQKRNRAQQNYLREIIIERRENPYHLLEASSEAAIQPFDTGIFTRLHYQKRFDSNDYFHLKTSSFHIIENNYLLDYEWITGWEKKWLSGHQVGVNLYFRPTVWFPPLPFVAYYNQTGIKDTYLYAAVSAYQYLTDLRLLMIGIQSHQFQLYGEKKINPRLSLTGEASGYHYFYSNESVDGFTLFVKSRIALDQRAKFWGGPILAGNILISEQKKIATHTFPSQFLVKFFGETDHKFRRWVFTHYLEISANLIDSLLPSAYLTEKIQFAVTQRLNTLFSYTILFDRLERVWQFSHTVEGRLEATF